MWQIIKNIKNERVGTWLFVLMCMLLPIKICAIPLSEQTEYFLDKAYSYIAVNIDSAEYFADRVCNINRPQSAPFSKAYHV